MNRDTIKIYFKDESEKTIVDLHVSTYPICDSHPTLDVFYDNPFDKEHRERYEVSVKKPYNNIDICRKLALDISKRHTDYIFVYSDTRAVPCSYEIRGRRAPIKAAVNDALEAAKVKGPFVSVNAANMIRGVEDLKLSSEFWADPARRNDARHIIKAYHGYEKETKTMTPKTYFDKVIVNGPATIGFKKNGFKKNYYTGDTDKYIIKKADDDAYDLEKAFLMLYAKSQFDSDEEFHKWFKVNMKMFKEAYNEAHPDIDELPAVDAKAISENINATLDRMSKRMHDYVDRINKRYDDIVKENHKTPRLRKWTKEEEDLVKRYWKNKNIKLIAAALGRSEAAVKSKAHRLGLDKKEE